MTAKKVEYRQFRNTKYLIGNDGTVINGKTGRLLVLSNSAGGYKQITLSDKNFPSRTQRVHRLVAEVFIGNIGSMHINHIDRNRKNNNLENLELVTIKENNIHSAKLGARINVLTKDGLAAIKRHLKLGILTQRELSCLIGITQSTITKINQGKLKYYGLQ